MIGVFIAELFNPRIISEYAILPLDTGHLKGIVSAVFVHASLEHLSSNLLPFVFCGFGLFYFYEELATKVILISHLITGALIWFFAREVYHVGASGLIYALVFFILISALLKRNRRLIVFAFIVLSFQGGLIWGILPQDTKISWESHLFGAISGIFLAIVFRKQGPKPDIKIKFDEEPEEPDEYENL